MKKTTILLALFLIAKMAFGQWETVYFPTVGVQLPILTTCEFYDSNNGVAIGINYELGSSSGLIIRTYDSGTNWDTCYTTSLNMRFNDISFSESNTIFAVGKNSSTINKGFIAKSINFGNNWTILETAVTLNAICIINPQLSYIAGDSGLIYKTTNSGLTWDSLNTGVTNNFVSICFINDTVGFACSSNIIIKTTDGGINWVATNLSADFLNNVFFPSDSVGYCKTRGGISTNNVKVYKTIDQGYNWNLHSTIPTGMLHMSMFFTDENTGFMVGQFSVLKTIDGASTWQPQQAEPPGWNNFFDDVIDVFFLNSDIGFIVGYGQFYRTFTGGYHSPATEVDQNETDFSVYPNPAKTSLNIRFEKSSSYNLTLFSIDGRMVLNEKSNSEHHVLNIASLDKGIYLLKVSDNNRSKIVKVVIQ